MATPIIVLDRLKGSSYEENLTTVRIMRGFVASQLDTTQPYNVIRAAITAGLPQKGDAHPTEQRVRCIGYRIGLLNDSQVEGSVIYENPPVKDGNQQPGKGWVYRRRSSLQQIETEVNPNDPRGGGGQNGAQGGGRRVYVQWKDPNDANAVLIRKTAKVPFLRPMRILSGSGTFAAAASPIVQNAIGCVNSDPFAGLPAGFWLVFDVSDESNDGGASWQVTVQFISMVMEDWSQYAVYSDRFGTRVGNANDAINLRAGPYLTSIRAANGISRVGLYPLIPFASTFAMNNL